MLRWVLWRATRTLVFLVGYMWLVMQIAEAVR